MKTITNRVEQASVGSARAASGVPGDTVAPTQAA